MQPLLGHPRRLKVFALAWPLTGAALGVLPLLWANGKIEDWWAAAIWGELFALPLLASSYVCKAAPLRTSTATRVFATVGAAALLLVGIWVQVGELWFWAISPVAPSPLAVFPQMSAAGILGVLLFVLMTATQYALAAGDESQAAAERAFEAEIAAREAELRTLRAQVDPHFLFNCLHAISSLIASNPAEARGMCVELAEFFRESLRVGTRARISMADEAELVRRYLDLEQLRFGARLNASVDVAADAATALVPPLLLQPLAENAVKHGIATMVEGGRVTMAVRRSGDRLEVTMENPYDPDGRRNGGGLGLANVKARLEASYRGRASLKVQSSGSRFRAEISLPVEEPA